MKDEKSELDKLEEQVDKVLSPERAMRWMVRIVVLAVILAVVFVLGKVAFHMIGKVDKAVEEVEAQEVQAAERATLKHDWFVLKKDAIDASALEIKAAHAELARHLADVKTRFVSRESDRRGTAQLNAKIANAQVKRLDLIRDYNAKATRVEASVLGDLPKHIAVAELEQEPSGE
jgi:hypothetical protein